MLNRYGAFLTDKQEQLTKMMYYGDKSAQNLS